MNKTNQFNTATRRYTHGQMGALLADPGKQVYLYSVADRFGENGVVAAAIVDCGGDVPVLTDYVMSCRVMGRNIEDAIAEDIEADLRRRGYQRLRAVYLPTPKNAPVAGLYERLGYKKTRSVGQGGAEYEIGLADAPKRSYYVRMERSAV